MFRENWFFLKAGLVKPAWWKQFKTEMGHEKMSPDELHDFNFKLRIELLSFAFENSPYYHELYSAAGLEPGDVKTEEDWQKIRIGLWNEPLLSVRKT